MEGRKLDRDATIKRLIDAMICPVFVRPKAKKGEHTRNPAARVNDRLDPLVRVVYAPPFLDMHNRMKEALALLGRIGRAIVRPPLQPIKEPEQQRIREALAQAGLSVATVVV